MAEELRSEEVSVGDYHYFTIHDPKERVICAASFRERVLHHAIINVCDDVFERYQIFDSFACRVGKGQTAALARSQHFARRNTWYLKMDVHKYFDSIDHSVLMGLLARLFKDAPLLRLFEKIVDSYETTLGRGISIGNLTSQYFANYYLGVLDHFIKERLKVVGYVRYMDDMVCFSKSREELKAVESEIVSFASTCLNLEFNCSLRNRTAHGFPFLGFRVHPNKLRLLQKTKRRFLTKIRAASPQATEALLAFVCQAETHSWRKQIFYPKGAFPLVRTE